MHCYSTPLCSGSVQAVQLREFVLPRGLNLQAVLAANAVK